MKNGVLIKVTYPTLGYTEYDFGANRYLFPASSSSSFMLHNEVTSCYSYGYNHCCTTAVSTGSTFNLTSTQITDAEVDYDLILGEASGGCNDAPRTITLELYSTTSGYIGTRSFSEGPNVPTEQPSVRFKLTAPSPVGFGSLSAGNYYFKLETENAFGKAKLFVKQAIEKDVGGLRIEQITHKTKSGTVLNSSTFDYTESGSSISSGQLYVEPVYGDQVEDMSTYNHTFFRDMSVVPLAGFDGYHIGYERVVENKSGHGKTEHLFTVETREPVTTYPQIPDDFLVKNGQEDVMKVYNQAGTVLQSTTNTYTSAYQSLTTSPFKVFYFIHNANPTNCYYYRVATYTIRTGYNLVSNQAKFVDGMQYATAYTYSPTNQLFPVTATTINSDEAVHRTEYSYPAAYPAGSVKTTLQNQNRKLPAWKTIKKVDNVKVDGDSTIFSFYNTSTGVPTGTSTALLYPHKSHRYEMSWNSSGTAVVDGWALQSTTGKIQVNVGFPSEVTIDGWSDPLKYTWQANGLLEEWAFLDHSKQYDYYTNSSLLQVFTDVDETTLTYTWDVFMRLQDVTDCKGVKTALGYAYRHTTNNALINRVNTTTTHPTLGAATNKSLTTTTFFDDVGKPIQTLRYQQNPASSTSSIAEQLVYNTIGRLTQKHEPVSASHSPTNYTGALSDYTLTIYETSPLERPTQIQPPSTGTLGRIQYQYGTNSTNEVYDYVHSQYYVAGKLHKTVAIDANGNETHTFVDILGRTVLSRRKEGGTSTLVNTYTLYDDKNRPYLILPPGTTTANTNLIYKKVYSGDDQILMQDNPDQNPESFGYDNRELMIYRQDGNMNVNAQWYTIEYDGYGRSVKEGFSTSTDGTVDETLITYTYGTSGITLNKLVHSTAAMLNGPGTINHHFYYDGCGRLETETRNSTVDPGIDTSCMLIYSWDSADNPLTVTIRTPNGSDRLIVLNKNEYDHAGRLLRDKIKINNNAETLLSQSVYTVKEQISQLKLGPNAGSPLQTVDYTYLPNGLLQKINDPAALGSDQFGMQLYYDAVFTGSGITARKNGDISNIVWKTPQETNRQHYGFIYDYLDRLKTADYSQYTGSVHTATDLYNVVYQYDNRGNMTFVERRGANNAGATTFGPIDDLSYYYYPGTNCLQSIVDDQGIYGYNTNGGGDYLYDSTGNITRDPSKKCDLHYNYLNKLDSIVLDNGTSLHFYHDATGRLHQKSTRDAQGATRDRYYFDQVELLNGHVDFVHHANGYIHLLYVVADELILTGSEPNNNHEYEALKITSSRTTTGNKTITYTAGEIDLLQPFQVDSASSVNGQIQDFTPVNLATTYVIRDHLGNNRVFFWDSTGNNSLSTDEIRAVRSYYPFGMDLRQTNNINPEFKYGFGNKEELEFVGYGAFGARCMDGTTCRFTSPDPLSNQFPSYSTYSFGFLNPLRYTDPTGMAPEDIIDVNKTTGAISITKADGDDIVRLVDNGVVADSYTYGSNGSFSSDFIMDKSDGGTTLTTAQIVPDAPDKAQVFYEFAAQSDVEFGKLDIKAPSGERISIVTTSHEKDATSTLPGLVKEYSNRGFTGIKQSHSHPDGQSVPSGHYDNISGNPYSLTPVPRSHPDYKRGDAQNARFVRSLPGFGNTTFEVNNPRNGAATTYDGINRAKIQNK